MGSDLEAIKAETKKFSSLAVKTKMDLHDLSEELPLGWEKILETAQAAFDAHKRLAELKAELKAAGG